MGGLVNYWCGWGVSGAPEPSSHAPMAEAAGLPVVTDNGGATPTVVVTRSASRRAVGVRRRGEAGEELGEAGEGRAELGQPAGVDGESARKKRPWGNWWSWGEEEEATGVIAGANDPG
jgi:hypothetical protein